MVHLSRRGVVVTWKLKIEEKMLLLERWVKEANKHLGISVKEVNGLMGSDRHSYYFEYQKKNEIGMNGERIEGSG